MLETILNYLHNYFPTPHMSARSGAFEIVSGSLELDFVQPGQYFRIQGSVFNDGLHKKGDGEQLTDERFIGVVTPLAIPKAVIELSARIEEWCAKNPHTDKVSESFGGYSYSKGGAGTQSADVGGWQTAFGKELSVWKKVSE